MALPWKDTLQNLVAGLMARGDKSQHNRYLFLPLSKDEVEAAYRTDWIARKVVNIPAYDATRAWRDWQAEDDSITSLEDEEKRLFLRQRVMRAETMARLYGGAAIYLGVAQGLPSEPLDVTKIGKGSLRYLHVFTKYQLTAGEIDLDVLSPGFGAPKFYTLNSTNGQVRIHPSRIVRFLGNEVPDAAISTDGWGDSILQVLDDAIKSAGVSAQSIAALVHEAKVDVISVPDLAAQLSTTEGTNRITNRFGLANALKSNTGLLMLDAQEEWQRKEISFTGLEGVLRLYLQIASGAADIPATRLLGQAPMGLNATGDSDVRNYYDMISSKQEVDLRPRIEQIDAVLLPSTFGTKPKDIYFEFAPLWQMTETEKAAVAKSKADTSAVYVTTGLVPSDALAKAVQNQLVEDGTYPGLETALADAEAALAIDPIEEEPTATPDNVVNIARRAANDAAPRTLYVSRSVKNAADIVAWAKSQGFEKTIEPADMHVTIAFSRKAVDWMKAGQAYGERNGELVVPAGGPRIVEPLGDKGAIVLLFACSDLAWRHEDIKRTAEASWDYDFYQPHITITYEGSGLNLDDVEPYRGEIVLGPEIFAEVVEDWEKSVKEA